MIYGQKETDKERRLRQFRVVLKTWNREMADGRNPCQRLGAKAQYLGTGTYRNRATLTGLGRDEFGLTTAEVNACLHMPHFHGITSDVLAEILKANKRKAA